MIQKLRRKFVIINMALVATVLMIVFATVFVTNYQQSRREGEFAMRMMLNRDLSLPPVRFEIGRGGGHPEGKQQTKWSPIFSVTIDPETGVRMIDADNVAVEDAVLDGAVEAVLAGEKNEGTLSQWNLRYIMEETKFGTRIVFLDTSVEQAVLTQLVITLGLVGLGGLAAFLVISLFLASWALRPVEKAWAQQQQFVADASHELKTPLTVILANLDIVQGNAGETVTSQEKWIDNTRVEAERMKKLVEDMLFLAKSDAVERPIQFAQVSLSDAAWQGVLSFEPVAYESGLSMQSDIAPDVSVQGDAGQINNLLTILLDNACKYSAKKGEISLRVYQAQEKEKAYLEVQNMGDPIPESEMAHIFERFYREDKARARTKGGYGLGLAIAAEIVRQHHGKISVKSDAQAGTVFTVSLPLSNA